MKKFVIFLSEFFIEVITTIYNRKAVLYLTSLPFAQFGFGDIINARRNSQISFAPMLRSGYLGISSVG